MSVLLDALKKAAAEKRAQQSKVLDDATPPVESFMPASVNSKKMERLQPEHEASVDLESKIDFVPPNDQPFVQKVEEQPLVISATNGVELPEPIISPTNLYTSKASEKNTEFAFKLEERAPNSVEYQDSVVNLEEVLVESPSEHTIAQPLDLAPGLVDSDNAKKTVQLVEKQAQRKHEMEQFFVNSAFKDKRLSNPPKPKLEQRIASAITTTLKPNQPLFSSKWWMYSLIALLMLLGFGYFGLFVYNNLAKEYDQQLQSFNPTTSISAHHASPVNSLVPPADESKVAEAVADIQSPALYDQAEKRAQEALHQQPLTSDIAIVDDTKPQDLVERKPVVLQQSTKKTPIELAYEFYLKDDLRNAERYYQQALRDNPESKLSLIGLAAVAAARHDYPLAMNYYQRVLELNADDVDALQGIASISSGLGDSFILQRDLVQLVRRNPDSAVLQFSLGNNYVQRADWFKAQQHYFESVRLDPKNADYRLNLAVSLDRLGDYKSALEQYKMSLTLKDQTQGSNFDVAAVRQRISDLNRHLSVGQ